MLDLYGNNSSMLFFYHRCNIKGICLRGFPMLLSYSEYKYSVKIMGLERRKIMLKIKQRKLKALINLCVSDVYIRLFPPTTDFSHDAAKA